MIHHLTKFIYSEGEKYRFLLEEDITLHFTHEYFGFHQFYDEKGVLRLVLAGKTITVMKGYAWDGSSPKFRKFNRWMGTPDYNATRLASLYHDTFYQFLHCRCFPFSRIKADCLFGDIMRSEGFSIHFIYSGAVILFGWLHRGVASLFKTREGTCHFHDEPKSRYEN